MRRRKFITLFGGTAAIWPLAARAQQPALPVIGFMDGWAPEGFDPYVAAFRHGLSETSYVEGKRVTIEYRWAQGDYSAAGVFATEDGGETWERRNRLSNAEAGSHHDHPVA